MHLDRNFRAMLTGFVVIDCSLAVLAWAALQASHRARLVLHMNRRHVQNPRNWTSDSQKKTCWGLLRWRSSISKSWALKLGLGVRGSTAEQESRGRWGLRDPISIIKTFVQVASGRSFRWATDSLCFEFSISFQRWCAYRSPCTGFFYASLGFLN